MAVAQVPMVEWGSSEELQELLVMEGSFMGVRLSVSRRKL